VSSSSQNRDVARKLDVSSGYGFFFGGPNPHDNQIFCQAHGHAEPELSSTNKRLVRGEACRRQHFVRFPANHPLTAEAAAGHHMFGSAVFVIEYNIS
jgi:hypothetical protein